MTAALRRSVVFLVPRYKAESVSFIAFQYVDALRGIGMDARICSLRRADIRAEGAWLAPNSAVLRCDTLVTNLFLPDLLGFVVSRLSRRIRWVSFLHCEILGGLAAERRGFARLKAMLWKAVLSRADVVVAPSRYALASLTAAKVTRVIPHCIVPEVESRFRALLESAGLGTSDDSNVCHTRSVGPRYVFIGRDTPGKRLWSMLCLLAKDPSRSLLLIGELGPSLAKLQRLPPADRQRVEAIGHKLDPYRYIRQGDVVVCPSGREGFGMVPIECLARGVPVAVINEGAFRELYEGTSIVYERIADVPQMLGSLDADSDELRRRYVGKSALVERLLIWRALVG